MAAASRIAAAVGLILLILGAALYPLRSPTGTLPVSLLVTGAGLLLVVAVANARALAALSTKRSIRYGANAVLLTLAFAAVLVIVQAISIRHSVRVDVTRNKRHTPSSQTVKLLERLDDDVVITAFYPTNSPNRMRVETLLSMYANQSRRVRYTVVDPDRKPLVAERMGVSHGQVVVEYKGNRRVVEGLTEEKLTNAILFATRAVQKTVYFVTGHDEKRLDSRESAGFAAAKRGLEKEAFVVHPLSLLDVDSVPPDCSVLVLAGPKKELLPGEARLVADYLAGSGGVLFLLDPRWPISNIEPILARYHVAMENIVLLDELVIVDAGDEIFDATFTKIRRYEMHPITRDFRSITIFPMARPVSIVPVAGDLSVNAQYLAVTEKSAWGETDLNSFRVGSAERGETDVAPPLAVALAAERTNRFDAVGAASAPEQKSRIVVVGDSDFATNRFIGVLGNYDFFLNSVEYLAEEEIVIPIRLKEGLGDRVFISATEGRLVFVLCLVLLPLMVASLGGYVLLKKRRL